MRDQIANGRASRAEEIKTTLAKLPAPDFDSHAPSVQHHYPNRLKPWHHALLVGLLSGKSQTEMARELGFTTTRVNQVVNSPLFKSVHDMITQKRYESVVEGEHGVVAQARIEAPQATKRLILLSKNAKSDGVKLDAIKHVLALAGAAPVVRTETYSLDKLIEAMDRRELEIFSTTGRVPRRFAEQLASMGRDLPFSDEGAAIDVTPTDPDLDNDEPLNEN